MAGVGQEAAKIDGLRVGEFSYQELDRVACGVDPGPAVAAIDLEVYGQRRCRGRGELFDSAHGVDVVDEQVEVVDLGVEVGGLGDLLGRYRYGIGDVGETRAAKACASARVETVRPPKWRSV